MSEHMNEFQVDALTELANMAVNQAAGKLSELTGRPVRLTIPNIRMLSLAELECFLLQDVGPTAPCINQQIKGGFSGDTLLIYPGDSATKLASILLDEKKDMTTLSTMERSALIEGGNVLINAFMGMVAEVLALPMDFSIPQMFQSSNEIVRNVLHKAEAGQAYPEDLDRMVALMLDNEMAIEDTDISGHIALLMDVQTAKTLIERMEAVWLA